MHNKKRLQSFVLVIFFLAIVTALALRTKSSWGSFARQTLRETLSNEILVLSHLLVQKAQTIEDAYVAALNRKTAGNVKVIYSRLLQKNESGAWVLVDKEEVPGSGAHFAKQIPNLGRLVNKQWIRLADGKGDAFAGLIIPIAPDANNVWKVCSPSEAKNLAFGVFKDPFSDVVEIFKGTNSVFTILDGRNYVLAHSTEEYQGVQAPKDVQKLVDTYRLESFIERKSGKRAGGFLGIQKIPEINLVISAEMPGNLVGIKYYRWLFEMLVGAMILLVSGIFLLGRRVEQAIVQAPRQTIGNPALPQKDFVKVPSKAPGVGPLERLMNVAAGIKGKKTPTPQAVSVPTQVTGFQSPAATSESIIPVLDSANLRPLIIATLAESASDIRVFGVDVEEKLDDVPDVRGTSESLKKAVENLMKLTFHSVRQKMARKIKVRLYRAGKYIEILLGDNGLPRKTTEDMLMNDLMTQPGLISSVQEAFQIIRRFKGDVQLRYDFHNGNQIIVRLPIANEIENRTSATSSSGPSKSEEINKRFNKFQFKNLAINVRKPRVKEIEND